MKKIKTDLLKLIDDIGVEISKQCSSCEFCEGHFCQAELCDLITKLIKTKDEITSMNEIDKEF